MKLVATLFVVLTLSAIVSPRFVEARTTCDEVALRRTWQDAQRHYDQIGSKEAMTSFRMPAQQDYGKMTKLAMRAGDISVACGRPGEALREYSYAQQYVGRYDPADSKNLATKTGYASHLVLRDPNASKQERQQARMNLCALAARSAREYSHCVGFERR